MRSSGAAILAHQAGDVASMERNIAEATSIAQDLHDEWGLAYAQSTQAYFGEDVETNLADVEASIERFHMLGDEYYELTMMTNAAFLNAELGRPERQIELLESSLLLARESGQARVEARILQVLSNIALRSGDPIKAAGTLVPSIGLFREQGDVPELIVDLSITAHALLMAGRSDAGARLLYAADAQQELLRLVDDQLNESRRAAIEILRVGMGPDSEGASRRAGAALTLDAAIELAVTELAVLFGAARMMRDEAVSDGRPAFLVAGFRPCPIRPSAGRGSPPRSGPAGSCPGRACGVTATGHHRR